MIQQICLNFLSLYSYMIYLIPFDSTDAGEPGTTGTSESMSQSG